MRSNAAIAGPSKKNLEQYAAEGLPGGNLKNFKLSVKSIREFYEIPTFRQEGEPACFFGSKPVGPVKQ